MTEGAVDLTLSTREIIERASKRQQTAAVNTLSDLAEAACAAGIEPRHVVAAVADVLVERAQPEPVSAWRKVVGRGLFGLGAGAVVFWQSIHGAPGEVLIHIIALALIWAGLRLDRPHH